MRGKNFFCCFEDEHAKLTEIKTKAHTIHVLSLFGGLLRVPRRKPDLSSVKGETVDDRDISEPSSLPESFPR